MLGEQRFVESVQRGGDGADLGDDVHTVAFFLDHGADAAYLSFNPVPLSHRPPDLSPGPAWSQSQDADRPHPAVRWSHL